MEDRGREIKALIICYRVDSTHLTLGTWPRLLCTYRKAIVGALQLCHGGNSVGTYLLLPDLGPL